MRKLTATGIRQIEHSEVWVEQASPSFAFAPLGLLFARFRNRRCADILFPKSARSFPPKKPDLSHLSQSSSTDKRSTYLKLFKDFCHALLSSTLIFTHLKICSSPPLKSIPSCKISPSYNGYALLSIPGADNLIWFKNVPLELFTSLTYHCPPSHQNSQCRRDTTFDLNPTGAEGFDESLSL